MPILALLRTWGLNCRNQVIITTFLCLSLVGCQSDPRPQGHYAGTLYQPANGLLQATPVVFDITYEKSGDGTVSVDDLNSKTLTEIRIAIEDSNEIRLDSKTLSKVSSKDSQDGITCFSGDSAKLCYSSDSFSIELFDGTPSEESFGLVGRLFSGIVVPMPETPRSYTLSEALQTALKRNFGARIEYQHALQARLGAKSAYLQLLPHVGAGSVLTAVGGGVIGIVAALGDFAPFLFPSRWFQADEAQKRSVAEQDTLDLMRADLLPQVEGLVYTSLQDVSALGTYQQMVDNTNAAYHAVLNLESQKQMPDGSADHLLSVLQSLKTDMEGLGVVVQKDRSAIAQALGLMNPNGVTEVSLPSERNPIETAQALRFDDLVGTVLDRSLELRQLADLRQVAQLQKDEIPFDWIDPAYDSSRDLGFQLGAEVGISQSRLEELDLLSQQMRQALQVTLNEAIEDYNLALEQYPEVVSHLDLQKKRWNRVLSQVFPGSNLNTLDIQSILGDYLAAELSVESTRLSFRVARARIDRLLLQNTYAIPEFQGALP